MSDKELKEMINMKDWEKKEAEINNIIEEIDNLIEEIDAVLNNDIMIANTQISVEA